MLDSTKIRRLADTVLARIVQRRRRRRGKSVLKLSGRVEVAEDVYDQLEQDRRDPDPDNELGSLKRGEDQGS